MSDAIERLNAALEGRYVIERQIGEGGMGRVYLAEDLKHHRPVAIKVMRSDFETPAGTDRFLREVEIAARSNHPHIVPLYDSGEVDGLLYFVMPRVEGASLAERLRAGGAMPLREALRIARDVADGLAHAHEHGVVHRDIKPGNILISGRHALIVDFGVARAFEALGDHSVTRTGVALGSPHYMSPEQFSATDEADPRSDIYSLGCVLYEMLAGHPPFPGRTQAAVIAGHVQGQVPPLSEARSDLPESVVQLLERMLSKHPRERLQSAAEVEAELTNALAGRSGARPRRTLGQSAAIAASILVAGWLVSRGMRPPVAPLDPMGQNESVVVLPFHDAASTSDERSMLVDLADEVSRQLNRWESVRAVPQIAMAGILFDLGLSEPTLARIEDGLRIAEQSGVRTMVALTGRIRGDTAVVTATQFDVRTGRPIGDAVESAGEDSDRFRVGAGLVHAMLGLDGSIEDVEELRRQSASPDALRRQADGRRQLEAWDLGAAEASFREAIAADSTFAMAHHLLALTLYWQSARDPTRLIALGPQIGQESIAANRFAAGLPYADSTHIHAFYRFQEGDYDAARSLYEALVDRDPTDVYALLLLGVVEYRDPWLTERPDGNLAPRQDLNRAIELFSETVRLSPGFNLGYGHLFDIVGRVLGTADFGAGRGYELPRAELVPPWGERTPFEQLPFYPAYTDSIEWLTEAEFDALQSRDPLRAGASRLLTSATRTLRRWAAFAPTEVRPLDELVDWTLRERSRLEEPADPTVMDSLAAVASEMADLALSLRTDTTATELIRIGTIRLASGDLEGAADATERAQAMLDAAPDQQRQPRVAANVYLYRGQPVRAISLLPRESERRVYYPVPGGNGLVDDGGVEPIVDEIRFLAVTGAPVAQIEAAFARLTTIWSEPRYTSEQLSAMRRRSVFRLAPALAAVPELASEWVDGGALEDPIWTLIGASTPGTADAATLLAAEAYAGEAEMNRASRSYLLGRIALRLDQPDRAARHFAGLDSAALSLESRDPGWGLMAQSLLWRAQALEAVGDTAAARPFYERFVEAWSDAEPDLLPLREIAERALARSP